MPSDYTIVWAIGVALTAGLITAGLTAIHYGMSNPERTQRLIATAEWFLRVGIVVVVAHIFVAVRHNDSTSNFVRLLGMLVVVIALSQGGFRWCVNREIAKLIRDPTTE